MKAAKKSVLIALSFAFLLLTFTESSQSQSEQRPPPAAPEATKEPPEEGLAVTDQLVVDRCSACHKKDDKGNLTRISFMRTTPEGWQTIIKRMVRLNGLTLTPDEARRIVKYLSDNHGLAPEEARPAFYEAERRVVNETIPDESLRASCVICHSLGRVVSQRRTREEWQLLSNMHVALFPVVAFQGYYRIPPPPGAQVPPEPDPRHPVDKAIDYLARTYPLATPEWGAWRANMRAPRIEGRWLINGYQTGRGRIIGEMTVEPAGGPDEFNTRVTLKYLKDGTTLARTGRGIVYAGYSWRGRSTSSGREPGELREVMFVSRDWAAMDGRWYWGGYDELGIDVQLKRISNDPVIAAVEPQALRSPSASEQVVIHGANLPNDIRAQEIDFGPGARVKRVVSARPEAVTVEVEVLSGATNGLRDIILRRQFATKAVAVYDKVDYINVRPDAGLARVGGVKFPKQFQQFEAVAYNRGPDGKPQTPDDVSLGLVEAEWSIDEFPATFDDDDKEFVGTLDRTGLFTPNIDGPNPQRRKGVNNYGDVWVVASYRPKDAQPAAEPLRARSHLVVTVPLYIRWDTPEVSR
ncbi:MAG TPA: quinohemoprotein amine dehydrogenase subunit alpha [Blastocatellia bacterium]